MALGSERQVQEARDVDRWVGDRRPRRTGRAEPGAREPGVEDKRVGRRAAETSGRAAASGRAEERRAHPPHARARPSRRMPRPALHGETAWMTSTSWRRASARTRRPVRTRRAPAPRQLTKVDPKAIRSGSISRRRDPHCPCAAPKLTLRTGKKDVGVVLERPPSARGATVRHHSRGPYG